MQIKWKRKTGKLEARFVSLCESIIIIIFLMSLHLKHNWSIEKKWFKNSNHVPAHWFVLVTLIQIERHSNYKCFTLKKWHIWFILLTWRKLILNNWASNRFNVDIKEDMNHALIYWPSSQEKLTNNIRKSFKHRY